VLGVARAFCQVLSGTGRQWSAIDGRLCGVGGCDAAFEEGNSRDLSAAALFQKLC
jgi:hypothetical protein